MHYALQLSDSYIILRQHSIVLYDISFIYKSDLYINSIQKKQFKKGLYSFCLISYKYVGFISIDLIYTPTLSRIGTQYMQPDSISVRMRVYPLFVIILTVVRFFYFFFCSDPVFYFRVLREINSRAKSFIIRSIRSLSLFRTCL